MTAAKFYATGAGRYLGAFVGGAPDAEDAIEVLVAPRNGTDLWNGTVWVPDLAVARARASAVISDAAEAARLRFVTPGSGKAMAYQEKAAEAKAYAAAVSPVPEDYPLLAAEIGITAESLAGVAAIVLERYGAYKAIEAVIGGTEAAAKRAVIEAGSSAAVDAIVAALTWPAP
jgi:hypothetical protein